MKKAVDQERGERVRAFLRRRNLDALLAWRTSELVMLLGYYPHWGVSFCLFPQEGDPVLYVPALEPDDRIPLGIDTRIYGWGLMECPDPSTELLDQIKIEVVQRGISRCAFAGNGPQEAPTSSPGETPPFDFALPERLRTLPLECVSGDFSEMFECKTQVEVERIRLANKIALSGLDSFQREALPGVSEAAVAAAVEATIQKAVETVEGISCTRGFAAVQSGPNTMCSGRFNISTNRSIESGDPVLLELATCVDGYWSDLTRTVVAGEPNTEQRKIMRILLDAQDAAIRVMRPGAVCGTVDETARRVLAEAGLEKGFTHGLGHPVGFRYHDTGPRLAPGCDAVLKEGMVLTVEPGVYGNRFHGGYRFEHNVLITNAGAEILSA